MLSFGVIRRKETSIFVKNIQCHAALKGCGRQDVCDPMPRLPPGGKDSADKQQKGTRTGRVRSGWTSSPTTSPAGTWPPGRGLTSPSLPSQGSLALMGGKAPPPTGAVEPRPKESSLPGKDQSECMCMNNAFSICGFQYLCCRSKHINAFKTATCLPGACGGISHLSLLNMVLSLQARTAMRPGVKLLRSWHQVKPVITSN